jgi:hypothetical protein
VILYGELIWLTPQGGAVGTMLRGEGVDAVETRLRGEGVGVDLVGILCMLSGLLG